MRRITPIMSMRRQILAAGLLCLVALAPAQAETVSRIAAVVNGDIITTYALDQALAGYLAKSERQPSADQLGALRKELLSRLIEEQLVQQRIRALNLSVSDEEIENAMLDVQKQNQLTPEQLEQAVQNQGLTMAAYRESLRKQILRYKLVGQEVRSKVDVSESEVRDYYRAHLDDYRLAPTVTLSTISFPLPEKVGTVERERIRNAAREALGRLRKGEAIEQVAGAYRDSFGATGGASGTFTEGELTPEFLKAITGIEKGGLGTLAETDKAIVLLKVDDRNHGGLRQFEAVRPEITQTLVDQKTDGRIKEWTQSLKQKAFIEIRL
jgi:peptidyl-prolyl cis-trans isomerase SurA